MDVRVTVAKDGNEILEIVKDGQICRLNSTYKPFAEAEKFAEQFKNLPEESILLVFGFGNGIFPDAIMKACRKRTKVVFYEPCEEVMKYISGHIDIDSFCKGWNCGLVAAGVVSENKTQYIYTLSEFPRALQDNILYHKREKVYYCILPKYRELFSVQYDQYRSTIEFYMQMLQSNTQTAKAIGHRAVENNIHILKYIPDSYCIDSFINIFPEDMPAIMVSAGPSLEKNVKGLKQAKNRAFIVCVDTAVRYMLKEDILPDMIVTIDPRKGLSLFDDERIRDIPLAGVTDMNWKVLEKVQSKKFILTSAKNPYIQKLYAKEGHQLGELESGGSVATTAYSLCRYLGFKRLILVGQDLALTDNQMYAGRQKLSMDTFKRELIEVEDVNSEVVYTTRDYYYYLKWFEQMIDLYPETQVIDATEGGAKIIGTRIMSLQEALKEYAVKRYNVSGILASVEPVYKPEKRKSLIQRFVRDRERYNDIVKKIERGVELAQKGIKLTFSAGQQSIREREDIKKEMADICDIYESSDASFLIQREIDATDLEHYIELCSKEQTGLEREQYKLMEQYFNCILKAAKSVKAVYDALQLE